MIKIALFDTKPYDKKYFDAKKGDDVLARLLSMPNVIITSHQAFLTDEALESIAETTLNNVRDFFDGKPLVNEVCYRCEKMSDCKKQKTSRCF